MRIVSMAAAIDRDEDNKPIYTVLMKSCKDESTYTVCSGWKHFDNDDVQRDFVNSVNYIADVCESQGQLEPPED